MTREWAGIAVLAVAAICRMAVAEVAVDDRMPGGNVLFGGIEGDTVRVRGDMRDSDVTWFYWAFRVTGAEGRTLKFDFSGAESWASVGSRGPAVSFDRGETWEWGDILQPAPVDPKTKDHLDPRGFTWTFAKGDGEVWFSQTLPYGTREWTRFVGSHMSDYGRIFTTNELCRSRKGRQVEAGRFGRLDGKARHRIYLTARHHAQEASASFVLEGILATFFADDELGRWLREEVEVRCVPFSDKDGVVDGDQGKGRMPHDHARDYCPGRPQIYPEVAANMAAVRAWKPTVVMDIHSPWLRGDWFKKDDSNEFAYQVGYTNLAHAARQSRFAGILERTQDGSLDYRRSDDYWYGRGWNAGGNWTKGKSLAVWATETLPDAALVTAFEIPFANTRFRTLHPDDFRAFGRDIVRALKEFLGSSPGN